MALTVTEAVLLFGVAAIAGCVDTIAGGGGLIALPAMLMVGLPPGAAIATNKLQGCGGTLTATAYFVHRGAIRLQDHRLAIAMTFIGSMVGGWLILQLDPALLARLIPVLLMGMGVYFAVSPQLGVGDRDRRLSPRTFALLVAPLLGLYDGFFGPGTGMFMALAFVSLCGFNLTKATAHTKLLNGTSNVAALLYFLVYGDIAWGVGLIMLWGQFCGAWVGARLVFMKGAALIRPMVTAICVLMALKLLWDVYR